jgi:hypothetical protein
MAILKKFRKQRDEQSAVESPAKWSPAREIATSVLIVGMLVAAVLSAVPGSIIKGAVAPVLIPVARISGLDQGWGMFAPNPPRQNSSIQVHVVMADGTDKIWHPFDDPGMRQMQWRKFKEEIINSKEYRPGLALWAIGRTTDKSKNERAVRVLITADIETVPLPGHGQPKTIKKLLLDQQVPAYLATGLSK